MLFLVTASHSVENCPMYHPDQQIAVQEAFAARTDLAAELGITVHFELTAAPDHVFYHLLEASDFTAIQRYLAANPIKQEFEIKKVVSIGGTPEATRPAGQ
jgi:hypothetical protein